MNDGSKKGIVVGFCLILLAIFFAQQMLLFFEWSAVLGAAFFCLSWLLAGVGLIVVIYYVRRKK